MVAGTLGVASLAAATILMSVNGTLFMIPLGIQEATCALIGNCIGANNVSLAKRFNALNSKFCFTIVFINVMVTVLARHAIIGVFNKDPEVAQIANVSLLVACSWYVFDGMQAYYQGPIRAIGLQRVASYVTIGCCWIIGVPLACLFALVADWGLPGL